jgi:hypothetical protein
MTAEGFEVRRRGREHYQRDRLGLDLMPGEHLELTVPISGKAGDQVIDGFGSLRIRAMEGRGLIIEISEDLSGVTLAAQIDPTAGRRTRVHNLSAPMITRAIEDASTEDGPEPWVMPQPV